MSPCKLDVHRTHPFGYRAIRVVGSPEMAANLWEPGHEVKLKRKGSSEKAFAARSALMW